jgi:Uma2 family endonuclease
MHLDDRVLGLLDAEKPYIEIIDGRGHEKTVSPDWLHMRAQSELCRIFMDYKDEHGGDAGVELRFVATQPSGKRTTILADVSYFSADQMREMTDEEKRYPRKPPYTAVEVRSRGDRRGKRERKIELYLMLGSRLVLDVDPRRETVTSIDARGPRIFRKSEIFEHEALPGLRIELEPFFTQVNR